MFYEAPYLRQVGSGKEHEGVGLSLTLTEGEQEEALIWQSSGMTQRSPPGVWKMQVVMLTGQGKARHSGSRGQSLAGGLQQQSRQQKALQQ